MAQTKAASASSKPNFKRLMPWLLIIGGLIGLICSFIIMYEKIELQANPNHSTICDINPIVSCGSVMKSDQSNAFGFPNPLIGLAAFPILITIGMALLAGARFKRWFWIGLQLGTIFGLGFVHWLFYQTTYNIGALCPFCVVVWIVTIATFWYVLMHNLKQAYIKLPQRFAKLSLFVQRHHLDILIVWYLVIAALIIKHFWYYFGSL